MSINKTKSRFEQSFTLTGQERQNNELPPRVATVQDPAPEIFALPEIFPKKPLPVPGLEYTLADPGYPELIGVNPENGFPVDTAINPSTGEPPWQRTKQFEQLADSLATAVISTADNREPVRIWLEKQGIQGHAVTSRVGGPTEIAHNTYSVLKFGLWPESVGGESEPTRMPHPWLGEFSTTTTGASAGDHFGSICVIPQSGPEGFVALPQEYGGGAFIPPLEMWAVVPNQEVKDALIKLVQADPFAKHDLQTLHRLKENIVTYDDILEGNVAFGSN